MKENTQLKDVLEGLVKKIIVFNGRNHRVAKVDFYMGRYMIYTDLRTFVYYAEEFEKFLNSVKVIDDATPEVVNEVSDPEIMAASDDCKTDLSGYRRVKILLFIHSKTVRELAKYCGIKTEDFSRIINGNKEANHQMIYEKASAFFSVPVRVFTDKSVVLKLERYNVEII